MVTEQSTQDVRSYVREHYGQIAENFKPSKQASCGCSTSSDDLFDSFASSGCCGAPPDDEERQVASPVAQIYETDDVLNLPVEVSGLSLGCGDPVTLAALLPGQTVLDLGSGGGIDCFLAARKVGPTGHVIGVDMTPAMLEKARVNQVKMGADNVEFRLGEIEHLPVADSTVDVVISNCVINLSPDKPQVFREAFRVLRPDGKLAVSDIVTDGPLSESIKNSLSSWAGCVAGALDVQEYLATIRAVGFVDVEVTPVYLPREMVDEGISQLDGKINLSDVPKDTLYKAIFSAKITARKPIRGRLKITSGFRQVSPAENG